MAITSIGDSSPSPALSSSASATAALQASSSSTPTIATIHCNTVADDQRMHFLPRVFGHQYMLRGEAAVFNWLAEICPDYHGGLWDFIDLSNGGFYLRLITDTPMDIVVDSNGYSGTLSPDAAGIVATLFALNDLLWRGADHLHDAFYLLRDLAAEHPEARLILQAID